jgi:TPR repeat protein
MYRQGLGVAVDADKACDLYVDGAEEGNAQCQANLAVCFDSGVGRPRDPVLAYVWYRRSVLLGLAKAEAKAADMASELTPEQKAAADKVIEEASRRQRPPPEHTLEQTGRP